ncbi:hypothetical protein F5B22DRAFT_615989 [Xylaria bambusicola]|uniref:uncharacterized protein n=1 Tax=Xylaria bambusicola TaxID=326684 RepID=UPI0020075F73|nr:uncharacterized protein F5B22DRAFT_615989 [Xylaria bambusicola]KAI0509765.1 hypothetical protein F5B22DRAFT_615989 [Xylaria bambusicola]
MITWVFSRQPNTVKLTSTLLSLSSPTLAIRYPSGINQAVPIFCFWINREKESLIRGHPGLGSWATAWYIELADLA